MQRIARAGETGSFTPEDVRDAHEWDHCAVGELKDAIAHRQSGKWPDAPKNTKLYRLGLAFDEAVQRGDPEAAALLYLQIQAAAARTRTR